MPKVSVLPLTVKSPKIVTLSSVSRVIVEPPSEAYIILLPSFTPADAVNNPATLAVELAVNTPVLVSVPSQVKAFVILPPVIVKSPAIVALRLESIDKAFVKVFPLVGEPVPLVLLPILKLPEVSE